MARIIVADDAAFMRMMLKNTLVEAGHVIVAEAATGEDAIAAYRIHKPDLVTMDITMPDMDGIDAVKELISLYPEARVIMCSAMGQQSMVIKAFKAGAIGFIVKPFEPERVIQEVKNSLIGSF